VAAGGALFAYSKRQTIRLAAELDRARAEGAASFNELDTCIASHQLAKHEVLACRDAQSRQEAQYRAKLRQVAKNGGATESSFARQMQALEATYATRVKSCEDEKATASRARESEHQQLAWDRERKEALLASERDEQHRLAETRARELDRCRADLATQSRAPALGDHSSPTDIIGPSSVGETPLPGSGPKYMAPPAPEPSPFGAAPLEGKLFRGGPSPEEPASAPSAAAANW
jgi:eukaryotic-like serine/threonine-protein kinase